MRGALEQPGRTAALVTPDRHLARRVAVELRRWQIEVDDSAGTPLDQTPPGAFLLLTARLIVEGVEPVTLLATLKHPLASGGMSPAAFRQRARELELACLRGPRIAGGFAGVLSELRRVRLGEPQRARLIAWVDGPAGSARAVRRAGRARRDRSRHVDRAPIWRSPKAWRATPEARQASSGAARRARRRRRFWRSCWRSGRRPGR